MEREHTAYQQHLWRCRSWTTQTRIYTAELKQNLFGEWVVIRHWSGKNTRGGQRRTDYVESYAQGIVLLDETGKRRVQRGYVEDKPSL